MTPFRQLHAGWLVAFLIAALATAVCLIIGAWFEPVPVAAGWLIGFVFWSQVLVGGLLLVMIHRLTGGRWGEIAAPVLIPTAAAVPGLTLLAIPFFVAIPVLYPWVHQPAEIKPDVLTYYLNVPFFVARSLVALLGWTALSMVLLRTVGMWSALLAAFGLVFHGLIVSSIAIDWYLSQAAPFTSSSFGASVAVIQLMAGMAWVAAIGPEGEGQPHASDLGALLLAFVLGITYIDFMAVLVIWYGDLPHEEIWFVVRSPWLPLGVAAFLLVSVVPIFALMLARVRANRSALRLLGVTVLVGLALYDAYLIAPSFGVVSLVWALLSVIAIGLALAALFSRAERMLAGTTRPFYVR